MGWIILFILIGAPIIELSVLIDVGGNIGALPTIALCLLTAGMGLTLVRAQGIQVIARMQSAMQAGEPFGQEMIHGLFLLLAGIMLMFPGFISDSIGALLLMPPVRVFLGSLGLAHFVVKNKGQFQAHHYEYHHKKYQTKDMGDDHHGQTTVIDIESTEITPVRSEITQGKDDNSAKGDAKDTANP